MLLALSDVERRFLEELNARGVRYMIVGLSAAARRSLGDRFDVVNLMSGLGTFDKEYPDAVDAQIDGVDVKVLPLSRILASKRAADRPKDRAVIPALEEALAAIEGAAMNGDD